MDVISYLFQNKYMVICCCLLPAFHQLRREKMDVWGERKELKKFSSFFKGHSLASSKNKLRRAYGRQNRRREEDQDGYSWEMLPFHWPTCMKSKPSIFLSLDISPSSRLKKEKNHLSLSSSMIIDQGIGKTTLVMKVLESLKISIPSLKVRGFYTRKYDI